MAQIVTNIVQKVGGGIGFVSEAYQTHKANKARSGSESDLHQQEPLPSDRMTRANFEEEAWELDEAQNELIGDLEMQSAAEANDPGTLADAFISRLPAEISPPGPSFPREKLPSPIIIPQRRPKDRSRGLVRAYPPILETRGIDQATFIDFIETFNKSTQATKWIAALNLASIGTIWLPTVTSILVSMAITAATTAAMEVQGRYKTNRFLDKINKEFFMAKGLFCLVLTWNPDTDEARTAVDFNGMAAKVMNKQNGNFMTSLRKSNGKTHGEFQWPETAPLIYPGLDALTSTSSQNAQSTKSSLKKKRQFVEDYMDRRAQAKFAKENPDSALAAGPKPEFASRFADPSHPANSGSLVALLSGGAIQMPDRGIMLGGHGGYLGGRGNLGAARFDRNAGFGRGLGSQGPLGRGLTGRFDSAQAQASSSNANRGVQRGLQASRGSRGGSSAGPLGIVQKVMKKDVLYLLIVDMPSNDELAAAQGFASELLTGQTKS
ncbi:hypothetical protein QM012_002560 [Aureobasidium pullulans]|uniref:SMODS and SLOG-associating 2TM effector domain-containing protein n=1 Tax=Aureobasidium pullulans TaxID=5580 RepID=A0ABR0TA30_AURPU